MIFCFKIEGNKGSDAKNTGNDKGDDDIGIRCDERDVGIEGEKDGNVGINKKNTGNGNQDREPSEKFQYFECPCLLGHFKPPLPENFQHGGGCAITLLQPQSQTYKLLFISISRPLRCN